MKCNLLGERPPQIVGNHFSSVAVLTEIEQMYVLPTHGSLLSLYSSTCNEHQVFKKRRETEKNMRDIDASSAFTWQGNTTFYHRISEVFGKALLLSVKDSYCFQQTRKAVVWHSTFGIVRKRPVYSDGEGQRRKEKKNVIFLDIQVCMVVHARMWQRDWQKTQKTNLQTSPWLAPFELWFILACHVLVLQISFFLLRKISLSHFSFAFLSGNPQKLPERKRCMLGKTQVIGFVSHLSWESPHWVDLSSHLRKRRIQRSEFLNHSEAVSVSLLVCVFVGTWFWGQFQATKTFFRKLDNTPN